MNINGFITGFLMALACFLAFLFFSAIARAEPYTVTFQNKCEDIDPAKPDWTCLNLSQGCQRAETLAQVAKAIRNTKYKKHITIYSIDPKRRGGDYLFGAWKVRGKVYFACMPGCVNAKRDLERLLRGQR